MNEDGKDLIGDSVSAEEISGLYEALDIDGSEILDSRGNGQGSESNDKTEREDAPEGDEASKIDDSDRQSNEEESKADPEVRKSGEGDAVRDGEGKSRDNGEDLRSSEKGGEKRDRTPQGRIQELAKEKNEWKEKYQKLEDQLNQEKIAKEDPVYTLDDFKRVKDEDGDEIELTEAEQKVAYYEWKEGYAQRQQAREQEALSQMAKATEFVDEISEAMEKYPEFDENSDKFDPELSALVVDTLKDTLILDDKGQIVGSSISPMKIIDRFHSVASKKTPVSVNKIKAKSQPRATSSRQVMTDGMNETKKQLDELYKATGIDVNKINN